ncbi:MAG: hypothetical protein CEE38_20080 [Planctomycetes bacterium B3_Pla]|nr:MAG: hypothetical protein CEE38_20080 [Planctomycetes bacterium B3_Pla]
MSTDVQIHANRQNAQKSTGPRTAEGKAAVAQNSLKHGLFSAADVVFDESREDYDLLKEKMLAEMRPAGYMELMLAERIVSLSWRLKRAERMHNETIEVFLRREVTGPAIGCPKRIYHKCYKMSLPQDIVRFYHEDKGLGCIAIDDFAHSRVLERLLMYEQRIEQSLDKTMTKLKKLQLMRKMEANDIAKQKYLAEVNSAMDNADDCKEQTTNCAKQSQFSPSQIGVTSLVQDVYQKLSHPGHGQNKANQSQFQAPPKAAGRTKACLQVSSGPEAAG